MDLADTRLIFSDELRDGMTVLSECGGMSPITAHALCTVEATTHPGHGHYHELTVIRLRGEHVRNAIVVDEDGNQQPFYCLANETLRVRLAVAADPVDSEHHEG